MRLHLHRLWRAALTLLILLGALMHALGVYEMGPLRLAEQRLYDARLRLFMPGGLDERIVIVDVDEASMAELGQWPWPREHMAQLVQEVLHRQRASVIGFDAVFAESQREGEGEGDERFAAALQGQAAVLGYYLTSDRQGRQSGVLPAPIAPLQAPDSAALHWNGYGANVSVLAAAAPQGFFNAQVDADGIVRSVPLVAAIEGGWRESLALAVTRQHLRQATPPVTPALLWQEQPPAPEGVQFLAQTGQGATGQALPQTPLSAEGAVLVPYRGPGGPHGGSFAYIPAVDVLRSRLPEGMLAGRIVLLGFTAPGLMDLRATPVAAVYPGVEVHANLIAGMLDGRVPESPAYAPALDTALLLLSGLLLALRLPRASVAGALTLGLGVAAAQTALNFWLYQAFHLALPLAVQLLSVLALLALNMIYGYFIESRTRRRIVDLFGTYVPPELVQRMASQPDLYTMRAETREITVMFCDIRGFTSLSETMPPLQLQELLNSVFTRLTQVISEHEGTIDKYMGDCVMAFWGAPLGNRQHAARATAAALAMTRAIDEINVARARAGQPRLGVGIGLNTGPACVGDMGSNVRRAYTAVGDAVNLASRLEAQTREWGITIIASDATRQQAEEAAVWQKLDHIFVRGRQEAVTIHTPRALAQAGTPQLGRELALWHQALVDWQAMRLRAFAQKLHALQAINPHFEPYAIYARRLQACRNEAPAHAPANTPVEAPASGPAQAREARLAPET